MLGTLVRRLRALQLGRIRARQRGQDLVEYGLIAATIAFAAVLGLGMITSAQKSYFTGLPLVQPTPGVPGSILHPVTVDPSTCTPNPWPLNSALTCSPSTVHDTYWNAAARNQPLGTLTWSVGATVIGSCPLVAVTISTSSCTPVLSPSPPALPGAMAGTTQQVTVAYVPTSNHVLANSPPSSLVILRNLQFSPLPQCVSASGIGTVEVGSPTLCTATVVDASSSPALPAANQQVTWSASGTPSGNGDPSLSCSTVGATFSSVYWNNPPLSTLCTPANSLTCTTNSAGQCGVVYRRIRTGGNAPSPFTSGDQVLSAGSQDLSVTLFFGAIGVTTTVNVTASQSLHPTMSWMQCHPVTSNVTLPYGNGNQTYQHATFTATGFMNITGAGGTVACTAYVVDTSTSAALYCSGGPAPPPPPYTTAYTCDSTAPYPDQYDAHAPVGEVTWTWADGMTWKCTLKRLDPLSPQIALQVPNETPYASTCDSPNMVLNAIPGDTLPKQYLLDVAQTGPSSTHIDGGQDHAVQIYIGP